MARRNIVEYVANFSHHGSEVACVERRGYRTVRSSYRAVAEAAARFARELQARGIGKGDRILLWGPNSAPWVAAFFGSVLRGVVVVPMDEIAADDFARRVLDATGARLLVGARAHCALALPVPALALEDLDEQLARHPADPPPVADLRREDTVEIVFTSGTTAEPKGVVISHGNILANLEPLESEIAKYLKYERLVHPLRFLDLLPLSHVFGQFLGIFIPQLLAGTAVFCDSLNPSEIMRAARREKVSVLATVPRLMESLRDKLERDCEAAGRLEDLRARLRAAEGEHFVKRWWRFRDVHRRFGWKFWAFISGGAALDPDTETFWRRLGFAVIQGYGLTETTSLVSVNHPFRPGRGSIGRVLPGRELKLSGGGEILVRGESVASAYWQGKELRPAAGEEGWLRTGDLGALDAEGNLYFKGRSKNVIVTPEGMNVFPEDLEAACRSRPEVRDCVVVGLEVEGNAEPCAVLILRETAADAGAIVERANLRLAPYQRIRRWLIWPEEDFPRTSTQKPRATLIGEYVRTRLGLGAARQPASGTLLDLVTRITGRQPVPGASGLDLTSVERVELLGALEDRFQTDLDESKVSSATTLDELERMLRASGGERSGFLYPGWAQRLPIRWLRLGVYYLLIQPATRVLARPALRGREHLVGVRGPVLIVSNHVTEVDIAFVMLALPARFRRRLAVAMAGEMLSQMRYPPADLPWLRRRIEQLGYFLVVALFNVFPLPQQTGFRESFVFAGESADRGYSIVVFPEGQRTRDGKLAPFRAGIGMLANNLDLPVVPVRTDGLFELKKAKRRFAPPRAVTVTIGAPVRYQPGSGASEIARDLERRTVALESAQGR
ncbi:MAG: AMP-binding protein [Acidobacteria bacterium]|nr:MAG: AMP-binding protein [Acidobacteriota bacterium]